MALQARAVDPRDVNVDVDDPVFRVCFWRGPGGLRCREYEVTGGDVEEVLEWAEHNREEGETFFLGVITSVVGAHGIEVVLTRIMGNDPGGFGDDGPHNPAFASG